MTALVPTAVGAAAGWRTAQVVLRAWSVHVHDAGLVPERGPVILAANHTGFLDGPLLMGASPRPIHCVVKKEMFWGPLGWFLRGIGQIPVDRSRMDRTALMKGLATLEAGRVLVLYPEGRRGLGNFADVRPGLAWFALRSGAPVVPVVALGVGARGTAAWQLPALRARLDVVFGPRIMLPPGWSRSAAALSAAGQKLQAALAAHHAAVVKRYSAAGVFGTVASELP
ncbi:MAG: 1-acyl-sn-glycerol-3-phosphate acyltransferase [Jiangellaceae bacterium]|nr:1-acyl-sn-glycerol-3-phosphate acyltransferase [Jiangellaceae bacterium]